MRMKGYNILERRYKTRLGEIDLVARKKNTLVFVEVKARSGNVAEVLMKRQQKRISRAALLYVAKHRGCDSLSLRFDVIKILPWSMPTHIKDAWSYNG